VIKEQFKDALDFDKAGCAADLSDGLGNRELEVRDASGDLVKVDSQQLVERLLQPTPSEGPVNALDLAPWARAENPYLSCLRRFRLLDRLVDRRRLVAKQTDALPFDVGGCIVFHLLGFPGTFSGAHLDCLVGRWLCTLFGSKVWMIVPPKLMTPDDWEDFAQDSHSRDRKGKARAIYLIATPDPTR